MKHKRVSKIISLISSLSLVFQSFLPLAIAMPVYAEDATDSAIVEQAPTPEITPEITPEVTPEVTVTPEITPEPTVEITPSIEPSPEVTVTPEVIITPEVTPEITPAEEQPQEEVQNNSPPAEDQPSSEPAPSTPAPEPTLPEDITVIAQLEQAVTPELFPTLTTDKSDYFPTDTVYITGVNFLPNTTYTLHISSQDNPIFNYSPEVTSDENGNISFSFTLDGNYRPNYKIEAINIDGAIVATYEFTDSRYAHSATVNGSSTASVTPGENITVNVTAWLDSGDDWEGTSYRISTSNSGSYICQNTSDHTDNVSGTASFTESFNITAPNTPGTYNLYLRVSGKDNCSSDNSDALTLINAIIVSPIYTADTFSSNTYTSPKNTFQYGDTVYGKGTRATAANIRLRYLDSHNDVMKVCNYVNSTSTTCDYILPTDARTGTWKIQIGRCDSNCSNSSNWNYSGYAEDTFTVNEAPYTPTQICHATGSDNYVSQTPATIGVLMGHVGQSHQNGEDIIPEIPVYLPSGQNWNTAGRATYNNNCVVPPTTGSIPGNKYNDLDGDGNLENGEPQLAGWTFELRNQAGAVVQTAVSTVNGFNFSDVPFGSYLVCEQAQDGWTQTYPNGCWGVTLDSSGSLPTSTIFGNYELPKTGSLKIIKDSQPNDTQNFVFSFSNASGVLGSVTLDDDGETHFRSNNHTFSNLSSGTYQVTESVELNAGGWYLNNVTCNTTQQYGLNGNVLTVDVLNGEDVVCTFVNKKTGTIWGQKFEDKDADGRDDGSSEPGLRGWTIYIDQDGDGKLDVGERSTTTNSSGEYTLDNLVPGTYQVCEVEQTGWTPTTPACKSTTIHSNGGDRDEINFSNRQYGSIRVCKMIIDGNRNIVNGSEMGTTTFRIDWNKGLPDTVFTSGYTPNTKLLASSVGNDAYCETFENLAIDNYGYSQEIISGSTGWEIALYNDQYTANVSTLADFYPYGTNTDSNGDINLALDAGPNRTLVILNQYYLRGTINVTKFNDLDGNGIYGDGESTLDGWEINLGGYPSESTVNGVASFENITPGTYTLSETQQEGWTQTGIYCRETQQEEEEGCSDMDGDRRCDYIDNCPNVSNADQADDDGNGVGNVCETNIGYNPFVKQVNAVSQLPEGSLRVSVGAAETVNCYIGNQRNDPTLKISRSNNAGAPLSPGSSVEHTISIKVLGNSVESLVLTDLLPDGFKFRAGSYSVTRNGNPVTLSTDPEYNSPGKWELGSYEENDEIVIKYLADISSDINPGYYTDLAWAMANNDILAVGENSEYVDGYFVGTDVEVVKDQTQGGNYDVEKKVEGEVLGASTSLPATGASPMWPMLAFVCLVYGIRFIKSSNKK